MAIVTRYFSTSGAGAADGTAWADRAALFSGGNWSSVITGFNFSGSDSLVCLIGPGSYTCSQSLASGLFSNAPTINNGLFLYGADSSGNELEPPDPDWTSNQADWDTSGIPSIDTTTNIGTLALQQTYLKMLKFTASGRTSAGGVVSSVRHATWCCIENSASNTAAQTLTMVANATTSNCIIKATGSSYTSVVSLSNSSLLANCRIIGVAGSSGTRHGIQQSVTSGGISIVSGCTSINNGGCGFSLISANANPSFSLLNCVFANNGSDGCQHTSTTSTSAPSQIRNCMITGNGGWGINANSNLLYIESNRLRDNTSGNVTGMLNFPNTNNFTTDSDDATEYVNSGSGDYRIKGTAAIWGEGYGVSDEPATGGAASNNKGLMTGGAL
jgi:hypothetical protein